MLLSRILLPILIGLSRCHAGVAFSRKALVTARLQPHVDKQFVPAKNSNILLLRGGAGPLNPLKTAQVMTYFISSMALPMILTPGFLLNTYGGTHSPLNHRLVQTYGTGVLGVLVLAYCLLMRGTTLATAYRFSEIPWIIECLRNLWKEERGDAVGFGKSGQVVGLVISAFVMYATTQNYADTAMKVATVFWLLNGLYLIANPEPAAKLLWGAFPTFDATSKVMTRMIGFNMLAHSGFAGSMLFRNVDKLTAFGIGYSSYFFKLILLQVITHDAQNAGLDSRLAYFWIAVHGAVIATILL